MENIEEKKLHVKNTLFFFFYYCDHMSTVRSDRDHSCVVTLLF